jgi:hypothetical protein
MTQQIRDLIDSIVDENPVQSEKTFNDVMSDRIADRLQDYRQAIANTFFNPVVAEENSTADTGDGEHGDGQYPSPQMDMAQGNEEVPAEETEAVVEEGYIAEAVDVGDTDEAEDHHTEHAGKTKPTHEWKEKNGAHHKVWHTTHEGKKSTLLHTSEPGASSAPVMRFEEPGHHSPAAIKKSMKEYKD